VVVITSTQPAGITLIAQSGTDAGPEGQSGTAGYTD
jgi:hypothetical protein